MGHHVAGQDEVEASGPFGAGGVLQDRPDRSLGRGRCHGHLPTRFLGRPDYPTDPGPGRERPDGDHFGVDLGLALVPAGDLGQLRVAIGRQACGRHELRRQEACHPLLAAGDQKLLAVLLLRPLHRQPELEERLVERREMAVPLCVRQDAVAIENERAHQALPSLPKSRKYSLAIARTSARWCLNSEGGSYSVG